MSMIQAVAGDGRPVLTLTLTKGDGSAIDLSAGTTSVSVKFRKQDAAAVLTTVAASKVGSGSTGQATFAFPGDTVTFTAGIYDAEVEISFNGIKHTVWDRLKFHVRDKIV
jgi:hypothetical protein